MDLEKECSALGGLFQCVIGELKGSSSAFEDLVTKGSKFQQQLKSTVTSLNLFLDSLQKVADVATNARGATREIGTCLTRICMRHRSIENRLKTLSSAFSDCLVGPLQEKLDEWRRNCLHLDKDHTKEYKRFRSEMKRRSIDSVKLQKLQKKARTGSTTAQRMLSAVSKEINDRYSILLAAERKFVCDALIEQRSQFCLFVSFFKPVVDGELSALDEISHLQEVLDLLCRNAADPFVLPVASEAVIHDVLGLDDVTSFKTPPSSPGKSLSSRKSSISSLTSLESGGNRADSKIPPRAVETSRFSSICSQDSGFMSQDTLFAKQRNAFPPFPDQVEESDEGSGSPVSFGSRQSTPSPSPTVATWPEAPPSAWPSAFDRLVPSPRPHTISAAYSDTRVTTGQRRALVGPATFLPPTPNSLRTDSVPNNLPCGRKNYSDKKQIPDFHQPQANQVVPQPIYANLSRMTVDQRTMSTNKSSMPRRPLSFVGDDEITQWLHSDQSSLLRTPQQQFQQQSSDTGDGIFRAPDTTVVLQRRPSSSRPPPPARRSSALSTPTSSTPMTTINRSRCSTPVAVGPDFDWSFRGDNSAHYPSDAQPQTPVASAAAQLQTQDGRENLLTEIRKGVGLRKASSDSSYQCKL